MSFLECLALAVTFVMFIVFVVVACAWIAYIFACLNGMDCSTKLKRNLMRIFGVIQLIFLIASIAYISSNGYSFEECIRHWVKNKPVSAEQE